MPANIQPTNYKCDNCGKAVVTQNGFYKHEDLRYPTEVAFHRCAFKSAYCSVNGKSLVEL